MGRRVLSAVANLADFLEGMLRATFVIVQLTNETLRLLASFFLHTTFDFHTHTWMQGQGDFGFTWVVLLLTAIPMHGPTARLICSRTRDCKRLRPTQHSMCSWRLHMRQSIKTFV